MASVFQTKRKDGTVFPNYRFHYTDYKNRQCTGTGYKSKAKTQNLAERTQLKHWEIRHDIRPVPKAWQKHSKRDYDDVVKDYLAWGGSQGGRRGRPWRESHRLKRKLLLDWWKEQLSVMTLADLMGCLTRVERVMQEYQKGNRTGKTCQNRVEALQSFCRWCVRRSFLPEDPLKDFGRYNTDRTKVTRAFADDEVQKLYAVAPEHYKLLMETSICSAYREDELRALAVDDLDVDVATIKLHSLDTKSGYGSNQPIPRDLAERLKTFADSGVPLRLYTRNAKHRKGQVPDRPLLFVSFHNSREFDRLLQAAKIEKRTALGVACFTGLRVTYDSAVFTTGASTKEAQELMRHHDPRLTLLTYARAEQERLRSIVEQIGERFRPRTESVQPEQALKAAGAENAYVPSESAPDDWWRRGELNRFHSEDRPEPHIRHTPTVGTQSKPNPTPDKGFSNSPDARQRTIADSHAPADDTGTVQKPYNKTGCLEHAKRDDDGLAEVATAWPTLSAKTKRKILNLAREKPRDK